MTYCFRQYDWQVLRHLLVETAFRDRERCGSAMPLSVFDSLLLRNEGWARSAAAARNVLLGFIRERVA